MVRPSSTHPRAAALLASFVAISFFAACKSTQSPQSTGFKISVSSSAYPQAIDLNRVGKYPSATKSGAGYFYDDVLEYRVWFYPEGGGDDQYKAFAQYEEALAFSKTTPDSEEPLVLVRQRQWIDEPKPGHYSPSSGERITEWDVKWLNGSKRNADTISDFMKHPRRERH